MFYASEKPSRVTKDLSELREITELRKNYGIAELRILKTEIRNNYGYGKAVILRIWQTTIGHRTFRADQQGVVRA